MQISMRCDERKCYATSPYHPAFVKAARDLNGKWVAPEWVFDLRDADRVADLLRKIYGTAGEPTPTCSIRVALDSWGFASYCYFAGRLVAERKGRDYAARLGEGVVILSGGFPASGGSMKHPNLAAKPGTVVEIRDVPLGIAQAWAAKDTEYTGDPITIVEGSIQGLETCPEDPRAEAIAQILALMAEHNLTVADLEGVPCSL